MAADVSRSSIHVLRQLTGGFGDYAVTVTTPSQSDNNVDVVTATVTGVKLGDQIVSATPTTALPSNQHLLNAYVSAADTVTLVFGGVGTATGASRVFNLVVARPVGSA